TRHLAEGVASMKSDAAKLDDDDRQGEALVKSGLALREGLEQLTAKPAECFSKGPGETSTSFGQRLRDVACGESLLAMLDPVPNQLQSSRALTLKVDAIGRAHEQDSADGLRERSQALLGKLNSNEQMLEELLNEPVKGRNVKDLLGGRSVEAFKGEAD